MNRLKIFFGCFCIVCSKTVFSAPLLTTNLLLNPGAESGSLTNWISGGNSAPRLDNGAFDAGINPHSGTYDFLGGTGSTGMLAQVVTLVGNQGITSTAIDVGNLNAGVSFWAQGLSQSVPSDDSFVSVAFLNSSSNMIGFAATHEIDSHNASWSNYVAYFRIPAGTRYVQYTMNFIRHVGTDLDAFVDDNSLIVFDAALLPRLSISPSGSNALVSWPTNFADGFQLQQNTSLLTTNWIPISSAPAIVNGTNVFTGTSTNSRFFRLYHP